MSRHAFVDHKTKLLLFWTPKVACTSLAHWFVLGAMGQERGFVKETAYSGPREWLEGEGHSVDYKQARELAVKSGYETCIVARHPVSRAISGYLDKFVMHQKQPLDSFDSLEIFAAQAYSKWKGPSRLHLRPVPYKGVTFMEFIEAIKSAVDARKHGEARLNHHWNTQVPFYYKDKGFAYDHVFYLENFNQAIEWLSARYGVDVDIPGRKNTTTYGTESHEGVPTMSSLDLCKRPELLSRENFMTQEVLQIIADAYAIDYEYFGYDPYELTHPPSF